MMMIIVVTLESGLLLQYRGTLSDETINIFGVLLVLSNSLVVIAPVFLFIIVSMSIVPHW